MRISDWSSDVCSSDLQIIMHHRARHIAVRRRPPAKPHPGPDEASKFRITVAVEHRQPHHADRPRLRSAKERAFTLGFRRSIGAGRFDRRGVVDQRSEEHTSELQSLMRNSYAVFCLKKKKNSK